MAEPPNNQGRDLVHPLDDLLRKDRMPHIWCPGGGIGTAFSSCLQAIKASGVDIDKTVMVSGIGCSGRVAGYARMDSFHTTHGRAIPFATGMKVANPGRVVLRECTFTIYADEQKRIFWEFQISKDDQTISITRTSKPYMRYEKGTILKRER